MRTQGGMGLLWLALAAAAAASHTQRHSGRTAAAAEGDRLWIQAEKARLLAELGLEGPDPPPPTRSIDAFGVRRLDEALGDLPARHFPLLLVPPPLTASPPCDSNPSRSGPLDGVGAGEGAQCEGDDESCLPFNLPVDVQKHRLVHASLWVPAARALFGIWPHFPAKPQAK